MLQFEAMAVGGLASYIIFHRKNDVSKNILFSKSVQTLVFSVIFLRLVFWKILAENSVIFDFLFATPIFSNMLFVVLFAWLIVNVSLNSQSLLKLNNKPLNFLGEISYGIYMYHMLIVFGTVLLLKNTLNGMNEIVSSAFFYIIITISVVLVSYLSKKYFEDRFLRLKERFS
jgi:peptidoglycan/LPS O-acetylase OafA/YrhL